MIIYAVVEEVEDADIHDSYFMKMEKAQLRLDKLRKTHKGRTYIIRPITVGE